jgi:hypothetical protein
MWRRSAWLGWALAAIVAFATACANDYGDFQFVDNDGVAAAAGSGGAAGSAPAAGGGDVTTCNGDDACKGDKSCCPTGCKRLLEDRSNCGGCGLACPKGWRCDDGVCACGEDKGCKAGSSGK